MSPRGAVAALSILLLSPAAFAQDEAEPDEEGSEPRLITPTTPDEPEPEASKDHYKQVGVALQIPAGVRLVAPYDGEYCGDRGGNENVNAEVCVGRAPQTLDFVLAYGVKPNFEVLLELRLGIERDFGMSPTSEGPRLFHWSPGVKFYFSEARVSKLFSTAQLAFDHTGYDHSDVGTEIAVRNVNGFELDLHPSYGLYFFVGEQIAFRRWFEVQVEAGIGIQGRYP
jgi:hypothetical protein